MMTNQETAAYHHAVSGLTRLVPTLRRQGLNNTADNLEVMVAKLRVTVPMIRDVELLNETGCCCGEIRNRRTNRQLCEACEERAGNGGPL